MHSKYVVIAAAALLANVQAAPTSNDLEARAVAACPPKTCKWAGHCYNAVCTTGNDCDGNLTCIGGRCGSKSCPPTGLTTSSAQPTTSSAQPTSSSAQPTISSAQPTRSAQPTTSSAQPTTSSTEPTTTSSVPQPTSTVPTSSSTAPTSTPTSVVLPACAASQPAGWGDGVGGYNDPCTTFNDCAGTMICIQIPSGSFCGTADCPPVGKVSTTTTAVPTTTSSVPTTSAVPATTSAQQSTDTPTTTSAPTQTSGPLPTRVPVPVGSVITQCTQPGTAAWTFDDGPYTWNSQIVSQLNAAGMKATFFLNGNNWDCIYNYNTTLHALLAGGHQIASHTWSHPDISLITDNKVLNYQIRKLEDALMKLVGMAPRYFRPPFGAISTANIQFLSSMGYKVVNWDSDSADANGVTTAQAQANLVAAMSDGKDKHIVLDHETVKGTVDTIVPWFIQNYGNKFKWVTVAECLGDTESPYVRVPLIDQTTRTCGADTTGSLPLGL